MSVETLMAQSAAPFRSSPVASRQSKRRSLPALRQRPVNVQHTSNVRGLLEDDCSVTTFTPRPAKHQRSQSVSAVAYQPLYDESFLRPVPPLPSFKAAMMASAMGLDYEPSHPSFPRAAQGYPPRDFAVFPDRTSRASGYSERPARAPRMSSAPNFGQSHVENRPIRPTSSSSYSSTIMSRDSFEMRMRSQASSRTSYESHASMHYGYQRPAPINHYRRRPSGEIFSILPGEVIELVLNQLKELHLGANSSSCATCWMRDLCSIAISARKFLKYARASLYEDIQLIGVDSLDHKKRHKIKYCSRMILLRRTLRANAQIAGIVRTLKAPLPPKEMVLDEYWNLLATVIMACPNFERLAGPYQKYDHTFSRLFHALATRQRLKEMHWIIQQSPLQGSKRSRSTMDLSGIFGSRDVQHHTPPGDLQPQQTRDFWDLNVNWDYLTSLSIHCLPGATLTPVTLVGAAIERMPAIQNLHLSHLPVNAFDDTNLLSLPALKTLRLSHLPGITSGGLSSFATLASSRSLKSLTLQHMKVESIPVIARILSNLTYLTTFSLVQSVTPVLPEGEVIWLFPYLASASLKKLHWDITSLPTCANVADSILAKSIDANGFPEMHTLRTPNDPEGIFQNLCRPLERVDLPDDRSKRRPSAPSVGQSSTPGTPKTPLSPRMTQEDFKGFSFPDLNTLKESSDLASSRLAAQERLEVAQQLPRFLLNVIDEDGTVLEKYGLAGFLGRVGSKINYCLTPDDGATDENGGLVEVSDLLGDGGEDIFRGQAGCTGRWNSSWSTAEKRDQMRWRHEERGRWHPVRLF